MNEPTTDKGFGELDGEHIQNVIVVLGGNGLLDRLPADGERAILAIEGTYEFKAVKRVNGRLVRELTLKAEKVAEPADSLADEVDRFVQEVTERREGKTPLPFDPETGEIKDDGEGDGEK